MMKRRTTGLLAAATMIAGSRAFAQPARPTVVLVHGAFADGSSWNGVIRHLTDEGYPVMAAANPLRSLSGDADALDAALSSLPMPVVLVGHSYGGSVISMAARGRSNVKALVFVSAFAPTRGESATALSGRFPGSTLGSALAQPVPLPGGGNDLYVRHDRFHEQFAADVPAAMAGLMAATQRPVTDTALSDPAGEPAWTSIPSWFIYGDRDRNIPPQALAFMAERASSRRTVVVRGASHVPMISHPHAVAEIIQRAAIET
ncbi:alpha/beta fold hydrolase [Roseomonas fluvialis]|uniref:Alpha/beta hydrolase n=1 Tax=Roseomonas fluvialis TaxID=1750527 RepID=A0ABM7Y8M9_9PROT|nr:alpha/beta hydrolase [Roseomonas fluvialis]BDG74338.1 alpha/beta hydrolase [Roseomonas fluvialis]